MEDRLVNSGIDELTVVISRGEVESCDINGPLTTLESLMTSIERLLQFKDSVNISFDGYDNDPREVFEIPEIREFVRRLDERFPFWFYFLVKRQRFNPIRLLAMCLCECTVTAAGQVSLNSQQLGDFLTYHFEAMNHLFDTFGLDEKDNETMSEQILGLFSS